MSKLSQAVDDITSAAADLRASAAAMRRITDQLDQALIPQTLDFERKASAAAEIATGAVDHIEAKANAVLGHLGELIAKHISIATQLRDGAWVDIDQAQLGTLPVQGRIRIVGAHSNAPKGESQ